MSGKGPPGIPPDLWASILGDVAQAFADRLDRRSDTAGDDELGGENVLQASSGPSWTTIVKGSRRVRGGAMLCVTLDGEHVTTPPDDVGFIVRGLLKWGQGRTNHQIEFDWHRGTQFTVQATGFEIAARYTAGRVLPPGPTPAFRCAASANYNAKPGMTFAENMTFTQRAQLAPAGVLDVQVPVFARSWAAYSNGPGLVAVGDITLQFQRSADRRGFFSLGPALLTGVVPWDSTTVHIVNTTANPQDISLQFGLAF